MYTAIKGIYENGQIQLQEPPPTTQNARVFVLFLPDEETTTNISTKGVRLGSLAGKGFAIPDNFNDPLDDFAEYQ